MTDEIREQLSALLDDELSDLERPLLVARLERDAELREQLGRYELIGEVMRGGGNSAALGIARGVRAALDGEPELPKGGSASHKLLKLWKPVAGIAVAASVALVAILTVTSVRDNAPETVPPVALDDKKAPLAVATGQTGEAQWDRIEPQVDKRLSGYLVNHNEYAASRGVQGVMPYARIVGFETDPQ